MNKQLKLMRHYLLPLLLLFGLVANAQIGYQVSLLNNATGDPRANETVSVEITLTDASGTALYNNTSTATTNDFGVLSLTVGDANTFNNLDASKLPLYISATVDGILVSKSQVLSVPVAEYAKRYGVLTKEILMSKTWRFGNYSYSFGNNTVTVTATNYEGKTFTWVNNYVISGNIVCLWDPNDSTNRSTFLYIPELGILV